jgi:ABC-2 type transport system ATP-binding protein
MTRRAGAPGGTELTAAPSLGIVTWGAAGGRGARQVTQGATQARQVETAAQAAAPAIRADDLRKTYKTSRGDVPAVRGIGLGVAAGELFGLLGPNGAGKSTTIGMLTTLVLPTGGRAWVAGIDVVADPVGVKRRC